MKFFICLCFVVAICGLSVGITREYSFHGYSQGVTWKQAQSLCRQYFRDLATVTTTEEHQRLVGIGTSLDSSWIGLHRTDPVNNIWMWSDGQPASFVNWENGWPLVGPLDCSVMYNTVWYNDPCSAPHKHFYCYRYLILVNELKTWEEALQYCTTKYSGLASLPFASQMMQAELELTFAQTDRVWAGLRFMDGRWFWLSGYPLVTMASLPSCPDWRYYCGAINIQTNMWENRDCKEKLNFLCWG